MLHERAIERAARVSRTALDGEALPERRALAELLVLARLGAWWDARAPEPMSGPAMLVSQIALGPPGDEAWMIEHRAALAVMARAIEEWASATLRGESDRIGRLEANLEQAASRVLLLIERSDAR